MQHWGVSVTRLPWPRALWGGAVAITVDAPWALGLLSAVLGLLGWRRQRALAKG